MNGVEAAASLFGSEEPASDPFAALGTETVHPSSGELFYGDSTSGSYLNPTSEDPYANSTIKELQPHSQQVPATVDLRLSEGQGQWNYHEENTTEPSLTTEPDGLEYNSRAYDHYTPTLGPTTTVNTSSQLQTPYNPYVPSLPASSYTPAPAGATYPYTPPTTLSYSSTYLPSNQAVYPSQSANPPPSTLPQSLPPPSASVTRPKLPNAYDPPFPTTVKSNRRNVRMGSSEQAVNAYNEYQPSSRPTQEVFASPPHHSPLSPPKDPTQPIMNGYRNNVYPDHSNSGLGTNASETSADPNSYGLDAMEPNNQYTPQPQVKEVNNSSSYSIGSSYSPKESFITQKTTKPEERSTTDYNQPLQGYNIQSKSALPSSLSHPLTLRSDSPHRKPLPPSPPPNQQLYHGRSSPHLEPNISNKMRSVSPKPLIELLGNGKTEVNNHSASQAILQAAHLQSAWPISTGKRSSSIPTTTSTNGSRGLTNAVQLSSAEIERTSSPINSLTGSQSVPFDPYAPKEHTTSYAAERTSSPSSFSTQPGFPSTKNYTTLNQYTPRMEQPRDRSMSTSSMLSSTSSGPDPYAPLQYTRRQTSEAEYGGDPLQYNYPHNQELMQNHLPLQAFENSIVQEVPMKSLQTPYAPSPSLLGANDPLGRTAVRIPVFSFGFGGKLVTCFHGAASLNTGFDVALSSRNSTGVHIRLLKTLIPESALNTSSAIFPGPLFSDPGTSTTGLVRTGAAAQLKSKKAQVTKYLSDRIEEVTLGLRYLTPDSTEGQRGEGKLALLKVLKVMVEHDGRLTGTLQLDNAIRLALVPRLEHPTDTNGIAIPGLNTSADTASDVVSVPYAPVTAGLSIQPQEAPISVTTLRQSALDTIQNFLLRGERRQAYHFALDEKLWAHAMVIASSIDKEAWKEVVNEFLRNELGGPVTSHAPGQRFSDGLLINGRESLRVAYSLFSGQGAAAVQELVPKNLLSRTTAYLQPQPTIVSHMTPKTPAFTVSPSSVSIPTESISQWAEVVAMMISSPLSSETSAALTSLGDQLIANQMFEAAHVCYLLAPQTSPLGGLGNPSTRIVLVGSRSPQSAPNFAKDTDPLVLSEIVEFALSLTPLPRGQDAYQGIPHLQAYRFIRAMALAEIGDIALANRYCEAITTTVNRNSPYFTPILLDQLRELSDRITGVAHPDKSASWMGAKLTKPSLDTIGGWLEGRFTKLVTGDAETTMPHEEVTKTENPSFSGPFSHYSTISSATPSARSSPQPSMVNTNTLLPPRSGSAMASSAPSMYPHIDRASSAMDYVKRKPSPGPRIASAGAASTSFADSPSFGQALNNYRPLNKTGDMADPKSSFNVDNSDGLSQEATWWGSSAYDEGSTSQTPTASTFIKVDGNAISSSSDGFISLMDNNTYSVASQSNTESTPRISLDDEDLGFGNSKREKLDSDNKVEKPSSEPSPQPVPQQNVPAPSGSWISRWWKRSDSTTPGPVKASLGEESSFYYDKEQKRWVNKKVGNGEAPKPSAPPPPRAQTASPGMTGSRPPGTPDAAPPARSASAIDLSTSPPSRTVMRVRSNLVPTPESAPSTPTGTRLTPGPPPGRPKSQASKRNIRSRYVDVLQQGDA